MLSPTGVIILMVAMEEQKFYVLMKFNNCFLWPVYKAFPMPELQTYSPVFSIKAPYDYSIYVCIYDSFKITLVNCIKKGRFTFFPMDTVFTALFIYKTFPPV